MSEIRDRAKERIANNLYLISVAGRYGNTGFSAWEELKDDQREFFRNKADKLILSIPKLAVVDRKAKLPDNPYDPIWRCADEDGVIEQYRSPQHEHYKRAQQDMLKEGWVKEVRD